MLVSVEQDIQRAKYLIEQQARPMSPGSSFELCRKPERIPVTTFGGLQILEFDLPRDEKLLDKLVRVA